MSKEAPSGSPPLNPRMQPLPPCPRLRLSGSGGVTPRFHPDSLSPFLCILSPALFIDLSHVSQCTSWLAVVLTLYPSCPVPPSFLTSSHRIPLHACISPTSIIRKTTVIARYGVKEVGLPAGHQLRFCRHCLCHAPATAAERCGERDEKKG